ADEILPLRDPRVQQNPAYLAVIVLARVIVKLGSLAEIDTRMIEGLYASDLDYLQRLYERINGAEETEHGARGEVHAAALVNGGRDGGGGVRAPGGSGGA